MGRRSENMNGKNKNPRKILVPAEREKLIPKSGGKEKAYGFDGRAPDESPQRNHIKESGLLMPKQNATRLFP